MEDALSQSDIVHVLFSIDENPSYLLVSKLFNEVAQHFSTIFYKFAHFLLGCAFDKKVSVMLTLERLLQTRGRTTWKKWTRSAFNVSLRMRHLELTKILYKQRQKGLQYISRYAVCNLQQVLENKQKQLMDKMRNIVIGALTCKYMNELNMLRGFARPLANEDASSTLGILRELGVAPTRSIIKAYAKSHGLDSDMCPQCHWSYYMYTSQENIRGAIDHDIKLINEKVKKFRLQRYFHSNLGKLKI